MTLVAALFYGIAAMHLAACFFQLQRLRYATKPLLLLLLALWYWLAAEKASVFVLLGLLAGFVGDTFLMWPERRALFGVGLFSFAAGHVFYILHMKAYAGAPSVWLLLPLIVVLCAMVAVTYRIARRLLPFVFRPFILAYMLLFAVSAGFAFLFACGGHGVLPLLGVLLFMLSDYILLHESFREKTRYGNFAVMLTYIAAQYLLMQGFLAAG